MKNEFHLQDHLFLLTSYVKVLHSAFRLHIDDELILNGIANNIKFVDAGIKNFYTLLIRQNTLTRKWEYLQQLRVPLHSFLDALTYAMRHTTFIKKNAWSTLLEKIYIINKERSQHLQKLIQHSNIQDEEQRNTVSQKEFELLLHSFE